MVRVLLADDHAIVAEGLAALLKDSFDLVNVVSDGRALVRAVEELRPDIVVADISMPLLNGLDAIRQIKSNRHETKIIVLTMHADVQLAVQAFRAGASGYVLKASAGEELLRAIQEVLQARAYLTPLIAKDLLTVLIEATRQDTNESDKTLTARQREVLQLIAEGRKMKEIASLLNISSRTAESHKYDMMESLGVNTTAELIQHAIRLNLVTIPQKG